MFSYIVYTWNHSMVQVTTEHYSREDAEQKVFDAMKDPAFLYAEVHYDSAYDTYYRRVKK